MLLVDLSRLAAGALQAHRTRTLLTALGIAVGIAAVVLLTSIGEGIQRFVLAEFTQFGTHLIAVTPGRATTHGVSIGIFGTVRPLTLEDAEALQRLPGVTATVPVVQGNARVEWGRRTRRANIFGVGPRVPEVWRFQVASGRFLPLEDPSKARPFAVLGSKLRRELFGDANPLGQRIRVGSDRYRVIGVMEPKGELLGFDIDDAVYVPAAKALQLFNREGLMEVDVLYSPDAPVSAVVDSLRRRLEARHGGEDFTITTQGQMLDVLGSVLNVLTFAVGALGGISLAVGAVGILTIMTIAVNERTAEIGLLRAIGAPRRQVMALFLTEATVLAALGGLAGLVVGAGGAWLLGTLVPALPVQTSWGYALLAEVVAAAIGVLAGVLPAHRAAALDPLEALRAE
jgi:putative ABC transport system permease protein